MKKDFPVHFPVISDNTGELAEAFGVGHSEDLVGKSGQVGFAILDKTMKMRFLSLECQSVPIDTKHILTILDKIKENDLAFSQLIHSDLSVEAERPLVIS